ncbi:MAG: helix-hairpin-helix domain-containing protein [Bacteroidota bacterium]
MPFQKIRSFLFNFFHFNKQERNGVFVLCIIIAVLFIVRQALPWMVSNPDPIQFIDLAVNKSSASSDENFTKPETSDVNIFVSSEKFVFNPNTITQEEAVKLGFSKKLSATLINFRNKGGKFFKSEDLKKLYGLPSRLFEELESYVLIPNSHKEFKRDTVYPKRVYEKKIYTKEIVEINSADSLAIVYLKGIGPGFTKRIIKYRSMLGGFHSVNQLKEVYGMTDSLFFTLSSQITLDENAITKLPINAIDFNSLRKHPYFNFQSAQAIINYRFKHGKLTEEAIKNIGIFSDEKLKLILPYLSY